MNDVNWPTRAAWICLKLLQLILSDAYGPESCADVQPASEWHLWTERCWHEKLCVLRVSEHLSVYIVSMQAARSRRAAAPLTVVADLFWNGAQQVTLLAKLAWVKLGSVCDLHSHMPGVVLIQAAAEREVLCCSGRSPWSGAVTQRPEARFKYLSRVRSRVIRFFKGRLFLVWSSFATWVELWKCVKDIDKIIEI